MGFDEELIERLSAQILAKLSVAGVKAAEPEPPIPAQPKARNEYELKRDLQSIIEKLEHDAAEHSSTIDEHSASITSILARLEKIEFPHTETSTTTSE